LAALRRFNSSADPNAGIAEVQVLLLWAMAAIPPTVLSWAFLQQKVRAAAPLVFIALSISTFGITAPFAILRSAWFNHAFPTFKTSLSMAAFVALIAFVLLCIILFAFLGWVAVRAVASLYAGKWMSDQTITVDALWLSFTFTESIWLGIDKGTLSIPAAALTTFFAYKLVWVILSRGLYRDARTRPNQELLMLRVFRGDRRSEELILSLGSRWRYAGSIQIIAGIDLATTTVEPPQFLNFVRRRLRLQFIANQQQLEERVSKLELAPAFDGRFRINQFFCFADTWQSAVTEFVRRTDYVILDLRGYKPINAGCTYEMDLLIRTFDVRRVVLLVEEESATRAELRKAWEAAGGDSLVLTAALAKVSFVPQCESLPFTVERIIAAFEKQAETTPSAKVRHVTTV
jgi:hypothetical protein